MASRRSGVRTPPAPPIVFHVLLRLHHSKRNNGAVLCWSNGAFGGACSISPVKLLQGDQESRPVEATTFRGISDAGRSNEERELHQTAEGPPFHRRLVERVPVDPGRSGVRPPRLHHFRFVERVPIEPGRSCVQISSAPPIIEIPLDGGRGSLSVNLNFGCRILALSTRVRCLALPYKLRASYVSRAVDCGVALLDDRERD
jgi:hypothetical protein